MKVYDAPTVAEQLGISRAYAYKIIRRLNAELDAMGHMTIAGKVSADYFDARFFPKTNRNGDEGHVGL